MFSLHITLKLYADAFSNNLFSVLTNESITSNISQHLHLFMIFVCSYEMMNAGAGAVASLFSWS